MSPGTNLGANVPPLGVRLGAYGCPPLIPLDRPLADRSQIEYLDLLPRSGSRGETLAGVAESQGTALLYVLDAADRQAVDSARISRFQRQLANRSDPAWLAVANLGSLELFPIGFHAEQLPVALKKIRADDATAPLFFQTLVQGMQKDGTIQGTDYVFRKVFDLLTQTTDEFVEVGAGGPRLRPLDVLSMAGRALFFRFLIDRRIVLHEELGEICPAADGLKDAFATAEKAAQTSAWLDETFNGDFLRLIDESTPASDRGGRERLYLDFYRQVEKTAGTRFFDHLDAILKGWRGKRGAIQTELDWGDLDFAHIPVGVLSQVYESFSHRVDPASAREASVHYTPRLIAKLMVDQAFAAIEKPATAMVLDPACGAGIFLVFALRRLVSERWQAGGKRPDTRTIQNVLYGQLRGFDVSRSALRLAALALYITAIELNATQRPPKALRFPRDLRTGDPRKGVLFYCGEETQEATGIVSAEEEAMHMLGSLGPRVPAALDGSFDLVIGNPPWTRLREREPQSTTRRRAGREKGASKTTLLNREFTSIGRRALHARGLATMAEAYENPDKNPDLPFLWRATEWAKKEHGMLAFALPARVFGRTTGKGKEAWKAVMHAVSLTGLLNGADLRKTSVWESMDMPFCLLFARNAVPPPDHRFVFAAPLHDPQVNRQSRFRLDFEAARPVSVERVTRQPWVLKTLSLGTWRDVEVMEAILRAFPQSLAEFWKAWDPEERKTGKGFDLSPELVQKPAEFLRHLPVFERPAAGFGIDVPSLPTFEAKQGCAREAGKPRCTANRPRTPELYQPPLVVIPQSPGDDPENPRAYLSRQPLAFSQSHFGYSCAGYPDAETLAAVLFLLPHTSLFAYFCLMSSRRTGFDRQTFNKEELDALPFPDLVSLPATERSTLRRLARQLEHETEKPWQAIDATFFRLYGLDQDSAQTLLDTLFAAAPYRRKGRAALEPTTRSDRRSFGQELAELLAPYFEVCGEQLYVTEPRKQPDFWREAWAFLAVSRLPEAIEIDPPLLREAMDEANRGAASRIFVTLPEGRGLLLGLLNQRRWWTITRARLCGQAILLRRLEAFGLPGTT